MKLALLSNQWQGVVRRAQQRRGIIDSLLRQWQRYREMLEKLRKWLAEITQHCDALQPECTVPLQQARRMLDAVQVTRTKPSAHKLLSWASFLVNDNYIDFGNSLNCIKRYNLNICKTQCH